MINKRLLVANIIAQHDECTFYDKKQELTIGNDSGKSKFLKHVSALSNSNPNNESYLVFGVSDQDNDLLGIAYVDDAVIQDLVHAYLLNPPAVKFENVYFPSIKKGKGIGLLTIYPKQGTTSFSKQIEAIKRGAYYHRIGSKSMPCDGEVKTYQHNKNIVNDINQYSRNSLKSVLDDTISFMKDTDPFYYPQYIVFKELFVLCWSGSPWREFHNEISVQIVNENVLLHFSADRTYKVSIDASCFRIDEYIYFGFDSFSNYIPFESTEISFHENGTYSIDKKYLFKAPVFSVDEIIKLYGRCKFEDKKIREEGFVTSDFTEDIALYFFICYLNGIKEAREDFLRTADYVDGASAELYTTCKRVFDEYENESIC